MDVPFGITELKRALRRMRETTPGQDEISYYMIKQLSEESLRVMLEFYNKVWEMGVLPQSWKEALVLPIRKPGKDPSKPANYRPIALTSHVGKVMERMITDRLVYVLEKEGKLSPYQSGFRVGRGTMDPVMCLEGEIKKAQSNKESVIAVFFDIEKAYDMLWREGLMLKLEEMGTGGRMFNWISDFHKQRTIRVRVGDSVSSQEIIENGTPQGSVISPVLFIIMINYIFSKVDMGI